MNEFIKEQLNRCAVAKIPQFDDNTTHLVITAKDTAQDTLSLNTYYLIEIVDTNTEYRMDNNIFNSNKGIQSRFLKCVPTQFQGNYVKFDAVGCDEITRESKSDAYLGLWLPRNSFIIHETLN